MARIEPIEVRLTETEWGRDAIALLLMARDQLRRPDPASGAPTVAERIEEFLDLAPSKKGG